MSAGKREEDVAGPSRTQKGSVAHTRTYKEHKRLHLVTQHTKNPILIEVQ